MESANTSQGSQIGFGSVILFLVGAVVLYYFYQFLYSDTNISTVTIINGETDSAPKEKDLPDIPQPQEGGEYTFNTWVYINSFNQNLGRRKHIFELQGKNFSTLLVGLGAYKNTLMVRTHSREFPGTAPSAGATRDTAAPAGPNAADAARGDGSLLPTDVDAMFGANAMNDDILSSPPICDLPEIDLQRWVMVTVVLNGRTIDVYLDGKLSRSCVTKSYYKVDSTSTIKPVVFGKEGKQGFQGFVSGMNVANYAMNPGEIYRLYSAGPAAKTDVWSWLLGLLQGSKAT